MTMGSTEGLPNHARLCQAGAEHFQQRAEFLPLRSCGLGPFLFRRWRPIEFPTLRQRSALPGYLKLQRACQIG
jgi:hypothetical protein